MAREGVYRAFYPPDRIGARFHLSQGVDARLTLIGGPTASGKSALGLRIARAFGGLLFLIGAVVCCYNIWMTVRSVPLAERRESDVPAAVAVPGE